MKKLLFIALPLFAFTCNKVVVVRPVINSKNCKIVSDNSTAANLLTKYTNISSIDSAKWVIDIVSDTGKGFSINMQNDTISLKGNTMQAVVYFLDKYCGVRFYMPTDLWTSKVYDSIYVDSIVKYTHVPTTPVIFSTGYKSNDEQTWAVTNNVYNLSFGVTQHTMTQLFYDSSILKQWPDIYDNGFPQNYGDQNFEPDFTKQDIVAASMYAARKFFISNPTQSTISFSVMDSNNGYPTPLPNETLSQTFTKYINSLADSFAIVFPNKKITYLIYGLVHQFPAPYKLRPNVIPITVMKMAMAITNQMVDTSGAKGFLTTMPQMGNHDWAEGYGFIVPRIYSKLLQSVYHVLNYAGSKLVFAHLEMYPNWSLDGPKYYEMAKIYDNPAINIDSIRTEFCNDMFGNGAIYMKSYFDNLENLSTSMNNNPLIRRSLGYYPSQLKLDIQDSTLASNARGYINQALKITTGIEHQRVQFFSNGFEISEGLFKIYNKQADSSFISTYQKFIADSVNNNQMYMNIATNSDFLNTIQMIINSVK